MGRLCWPTQVPGSVHLPRVLGASKLLRHKEAMARFLASWHKLPGVYECRGTMLLSKQEQVTLQELYKWALVQCRVTNWQRSQELVMVQNLY